MVDTTADYLAEIGRYPLLTKSQEIMLARQVAIWVADDNLTAKQRRIGRRAYEITYQAESGCENQGCEAGSASWLVVCCSM